MHSIGSHRRAEGAMSDNCPEDIELHRPYIDACDHQVPALRQADDNGYRRSSTAGSIPVPCRSHSIIIRLRIRSCLSSSSRQTLFPRLWTRPGDGSIPCWPISTLLFNKAPYENVIVLGHVQDENGQKMSKSKGNAVDPFDALAAVRRRRDPLVFLH